MISCPIYPLHPPEEEEAWVEGREPGAAPLPPALIPARIAG